MMVELIGKHRANHANVVGTACNIRHPIGELYLALSVWFEDPWAGPDFSCWFNKGESQVLSHRLRKRLPFPFFHFGFRIEEVYVARASVHEQEDDILRLRYEVSSSGSQRIGYALQSCSVASTPFFLHQMPQSDCSKTRRRALQEPATRLNLFEIFYVHASAPCNEFI